MQPNTDTRHLFSICLYLCSVWVLVQLCKATVYQLEVKLHPGHSCFSIFSFSSTQQSSGGSEIILLYLWKLSSWIWQLSELNWLKAPWRFWHIRKNYPRQTCPDSWSFQAILECVSFTRWHNDNWVIGLTLARFDSQ